MFASNYHMIAKIKHRVSLFLLWKRKREFLLMDDTPPPHAVQASHWRRNSRPDQHTPFKPLQLTLTSLISIICNLHLVCNLIPTSFLSSSSYCHVVCLHTLQLHPRPAQHLK
ncbi:hypothetical protein I3842_08G063500 [Carya illinoinensis]|uniref:Uncharacterized protein n=1 Tax=Carya illinoinensis TaxID=32201 RepID=A0A922EB13_CARIL|nr:hypothetical protein I3842_08G063500 [Carya illinoinensis]